MTIDPNAAVVIAAFALAISIINSRTQGTFMNIVEQRLQQHLDKIVAFKTDAMAAIATESEQFNKATQALRDRITALELGTDEAGTLALLDKIDASFANATGVVTSGVAGLVPDAPADGGGTPEEGGGAAPV